MPDACKSAVPRRAYCSSLESADRGIPIEHIKDGVGAVRYGRNLDPEIHRTRGGVVGLDLVREWIIARRVRSEDDVVAVRLADVATVACGRQIGIGAGKEDREIRLVCVGNLGVIDGDRTAVQIS